MTLINVQLFAEFVSTIETSFFLLDLYPTMDLHSQQVYIFKDTKDVEVFRCYVLGADTHVLLFFN
jgi:hypothetical protein